MQRLNDYFYPLVAILSWSALVYKLSHVKKSRDPALISLCFAFLFLAVTWTASVPAVWSLLGRVTGIPNIALLIAQMSVLLYATCVEAMLLFWALPPERARQRLLRRLTPLVAVLPAMAGLFLLAQPTEQRTRDFAVHYAGVPAYSLYLLLYLTAFSVVRIDILRLSLRFARGCSRAWLRRGLHWTAAGAACGLVYAAARFADVMGAWLGLDPRSWEVAAQLGAGLGTILTITGLTLPSWGPNLTKTRNWVRRWHEFHQLSPLWTALSQAMPEVVLTPPCNRFTLAARNLDFHLYRRVIEIQDARLALRPYRDPALARSVRQSLVAAGYGDEEIEVMVEAEAMRAALEAHAAGDVFDPGGHPSVDVPPRELLTELTWLVRVSRAFAQPDPLVSAGPVSGPVPATRVPDDH